MPKNTHGGSKHKSQARKSFNTSNKLVIEPSSPHEKYAKVTKMFGNGMCQIETQDEHRNSLTCHIRGKFRGKNKRQNTVAVNSTVIVGLREWESTLKNCDLIAVVDTPAGISDYDGEDANDEFAFGYDNNSVMPQTIPEQEIELDFDIDDI